VTPELIAAFGGVLTAILGSVFAMMRLFLIKEFRPNGGSSTKDQLNRLEVSVNSINDRLTNLETRRTKRKNVSD
jgi:hypothetical protein